MHIPSRFRLPIKGSKTSSSARDWPSTAQVRKSATRRSLSAYVPPAQHLVEVGRFLSAPRRGDPRKVALDFLVARAPDLGLNRCYFSRAFVSELM
jgi:hypothetical protein